MNWEENEVYSNNCYLMAIDNDVLSSDCDLPILSSSESSNKDYK